MILDADGAKWLADATPPILIIAGTEDRYLDLAFLSELAGSHPQVELRVWNGEGHDLPLIQPERCLETIERWSERCRRPLDSA